jgi:hypothetical protein
MFRWWWWWWDKLYKEIQGFMLDKYGLEERQVIGLLELKVAVTLITLWCSSATTTASQGF